MAFKEWAIVVDALAQGQQTLILRKGGIAEGQGGFQVDHEQFLLFPTGFHQQRDSVIPAAQARFDALQRSLPPANRVRITHWVQVAGSRRIEDLDQALSLGSEHIWRRETISSRFDWGRDQGVWILFLRVMALAAPVELPQSPEYSGCKSWIELNEEISTEESKPVLNDADWAQQIDRIEEILDRATA